jgi:transcriptional regulator with XRE-family HTH domain
MAPGEESVGRTMANCSLREVAEKFQVSVQRIQQIERIALLKVRRGILPYLAEHDPSAFERFSGRETPAQKWAARTSVRRQLSQRQIQIIVQLKVLAKEYEESGQVNTAAQIRREVDDLRFRLEQVLTTKDT